MTAREAILGRITSAADEAPSMVPRPYRRSGSRSAAERVELFCERVGEYRAEVRRVRRSEVGRAVADVCRALDAKRLAVPPGLPPLWRPPELELVEDAELTPRELDAVDGVLTGATIAIAETGTVVLSSGPHEGRRALTLVPDLHLCVVEESQIVEVVPEGFARLSELVVRDRRPLTFVSGPSATSDIELDRVEGVHGPRTLVVFVIPQEDS